MRTLKEQLSQQEDVRHSFTGLERQDSSAHAIQLINELVDGINRNVAEGINYHKALFEVRDATGKNRRALQAMSLKAQVRIPLRAASMLCMTVHTPGHAAARDVLPVSLA